MFIFPTTGETLTTAQVCEILLINYRIRVNPSQLDDAKNQKPDHEFFNLLNKWPWKLETEIVSDEIGTSIRKAAMKIGFIVDPI